jgi:nicotinamidase-related amidase
MVEYIGRWRMNEPKTLIQMAGANPEPARLSEAAVVIIDAQNEYVSGKVPLAGIGPALDATAQLLDAARTAGAPIIHVQHVGRAGFLFDPAGPGFAFAPQAAPKSGEKIVQKSLPNAFANTSLHLDLQASSRKHLILAGFMTHMCVSATTRAALDHGWWTTVVADATATRDLPDPLRGQPLTALEVYRAALAELADRFATVACVGDLRA